MSKVDKKKARLLEQLKEAESLLLTALTKKKHDATEVSVPTLTSRIQKLKSEIAALK